jgi:hypothetical protein
MERFRELSGCLKQLSCAPEGGLRQVDALVEESERVKAKIKT